MQLAAKACFSPGAAALVFPKLCAAEQQQGVQIPKMLRTHPLSRVHPPPRMIHVPLVYRAVKQFKGFSCVQFMQICTAGRRWLAGLHGGPSW